MCTLARFFFSRFIQGIIERYPELYDGPGGDISQHEINFSKKWKSYSSVVILANNNLLEFDNVFTQPLEKCLLFLSYKADRSTVDTLIHNEAIKKMGK